MEAGHLGPVLWPRVYLGEELRQDSVEDDTGCSGRRSSLPAAAPPPSQWAWPGVRAAGPQRREGDLSVTPLLEQ